MNEEIEDTEFYQQDFTTASDWEIFISHVEEIINQWKLEDLKEEPKKKNTSIWKIKAEKLMFADVEFEFLFYKTQIEPLQRSCGEINTKNDKYRIENSVDLNYEFPLFDENLCHTHSCIFFWYGLQTYYVLTTTGNVDLNSESKIKVLLSSLAIALSNSNSNIPAFAQIREKWQQLYLGVHQNERFRTNFSMVHLKKIPPNCLYLTDLVTMFQSKVQVSHLSSTILCATQLTYILSDFGNKEWKQDSFSLESDNFNVEKLYCLPFGVTADPIEALILKASWPRQPSTAIGVNYLDAIFQVHRAKKLSLLVQNAKIPICSLSDCLNEFTNALENNSTIQDILTELRLDTLVEIKVSAISSILGRAARNSLSGTQKIASAISEDILVAILYYLFPDADTREYEPHYLYETKGESPKKESELRVDIDKECKGFKTCPPYSLLWRFCIISACLLNSNVGYRAFAQIWNEFVQEMRYRWEKNIFIPGLARDLPDLRTCLLHQKLQMLNCCIERKKKREESPKEWDFDSAEGSSSDEEFFDCADKPVEEPKKIPVGRLSKFEGLKLIENGEFLYIPITQDPVPKTEDQLDEDADVLLKLGSDAQGSEMRAKLMSASLLSDMEAFKAANPGAILEDFVRWYSPRDWTEIEEEDQWGQKKGVLSKRMQIEDNIWTQTWKTAKPVPANKQKLLFVDTREAEKVLHFLESRTLQQVIELLIPILLQVSIYRITEELVPLEVELPEGLDRLRNLIKLTERLTRESNISQRKTDALVQEMAQLELIISKVNSLNYKLVPTGNISDDTREIVRDLINGKEVEIDKSSDLGKHVQKEFSDAESRALLMTKDSPDKEVTPTPDLVFPRPVTREFVLSVNTKKPEYYSSTCPQYLRAILSNDGMRLAGAFSEDICFF